MADDDDVAMREADAGLGADDEHDGARAGALARPSAPGAQRVGARFCTRARVLLCACESSLRVRAAARLLFRRGGKRPDASAQAEEE